MMILCKNTSLDRDGACSGRLFVQTSAGLKLAKAKENTSAVITVEVFSLNRAMSF